MGIWIDSNGQSWNINIGGRSLAELQKNPDFKFCWIRDTPGIDDESNLNFYHEETMDEQKKKQAFNKVVTVNCTDGSTATGRISHWVNGKTHNCSLEHWFILCTKEY
jgi:hypothetical protein